MAASDLFDACAYVCLKGTLIVGSTFTCSEAVHFCDAPTPAAMKTAKGCVQI